MTKNTITILTTLTLLLNLRTGQAGSATWNLNPTSGDWNTAANWTPATVPNDPADIATLGVSNLTTLQISADVALDSLIFAEGGSAYGITMNGISLNLWGGGVINESSQPQTLLLSNIYSTLIFRNNATAGDLLTYEITSSNSHISFLQTSSARSANFVIDGPFNENASGIY